MVAQSNEEHDASLVVDKDTATVDAQRLTGPAITTATGTPLSTSQRAESDGTIQAPPNVVESPRSETLNTNPEGLPGSENGNTEEESPTTPDPSSLTTPPRDRSSEEGVDSATTPGVISDHPARGMLENLLTGAAFQFLLTLSIFAGGFFASGTEKGVVLGLSAIVAAGAEILLIHFGVHTPYRQNAYHTTIGLLFGALAVSGGVLYSEMTQPPIPNNNNVIQVVKDEGSQTRDGIKEAFQTTNDKVDKLVTDVRNELAKPQPLSQPSVREAFDARIQELLDELENLRRQLEQRTSQKPVLQSVQDEIDRLQSQLDTLRSLLNSSNRTPTATQTGQAGWSSVASPTDTPHPTIDANEPSPTDAVATPTTIPGNYQPGLIISSITPSTTPSEVRPTITFIDVTPSLTRVNSGSNSTPTTTQTRTVPPQPSTSTATNTALKPVSSNTSEPDPTVTATKTPEQPSPTPSPTPLPTPTRTATNTPIPPSPTPTPTVSPTATTPPCDVGNPANVCGGIVVVRAFKDFVDCNGFYNPGTDQDLPNLEVIVELANGQRLRARTNDRGQATIRGVEIRQGSSAQVSIMSDSLIGCQGSSNPRSLTRGSFSTGNAGPTADIMFRFRP